MDRSDTTPVVLVGLDEGPLADELERLLSAAGCPVTGSREIESVSALLGELRNATVVVFDEGKSAAAGAVLDQLSRVPHRTPVVVIVDHAEFGQYYALMSKGVIGYFEAQEPPAVICAGVTHAARRTGTV